MKRIIGLFLFIAVSHSVLSQNTDIAVLRKLNVHRNKSFDPTCKFLANSVSPLAIATPATFFSLYLIKKDSVRARQTIFICSSLLLNSVISTSLKYVVKRERPFITYPDLEPAVAVNTPSFPSGHTAFAFSLATSLSIVVPKWYVVAPSFIWAASVGYSRMHLGVHYPSDVLAGALIGSGSAWLSYRLNKWVLSY